VGPKKGKQVHAEALKLLSRRALSRAELVERLQQRGFSPAEVASEVRRLQRAGLLQEEELARLLVRRQLEAGSGPLAARAALRLRQVEESAAKKALQEMGEEEVAQALERALARALGRFRQEEASQRRQKVVRYLVGRGFPLALVLRATASLGGELEYAEELGEPGDPEDLS
jgi:regulatory protein